MTFSQKVKNELQKIREAGKKYKSALAYGIDYGLKNVGSAESLIPDEFLNGDEMGGIFLRGVFLSCGSVNNPQKDYHLELIPPNKEKCLELLDFLEEQGLKMKLSSRHEQPFLYCKGSEQIIDFLTFVGATKYSMELMNVMIYKEIRNNVNRAVNCESANIEKTAFAASKHIADIELILKEKGEDFLPSKLREVAKIRRSNVGMSLEEIGRAMNPPISKSGVNHRLKKISLLAENLRKTLDVSH
ncbi:MAG: DNA-binding protein WhiA [Oscillospiraceae bacterium]|nr:DNA-binding protein WhiA [Oscillospiraceae bacterium]